MDPLLAYTSDFYKTDPAKIGRTSDPLLAYLGNTVPPADPRELRKKTNLSAGFKGDSQYDEGLAYGMDQMRLRGRNQPWYDQLGNALAKTAPAIALGILENAGYLGELFDNSHDYTNALTEFAKKHRQGLEENLPTYRQDPDAVFDLTDSGWWMQHSQGLFESIGEFLVTGAAAGGALGASAKGLTALLRGNAIASGALQGAAQLGTAGFLSYVEGAMSGSDVYQRVLAETGDKQKAAEAAAYTVRLNTTVNTLLNISALSPLFKSMGNLKATTQLGTHRLPKEGLESWASRLAERAGQGYAPASLRQSLLLEAGQEGLEELVNLWAEEEGLVKGGIKAPSSSTMLGRFFKTAFTEEGALSALLGAVGGVGQTAGMNLIPFRNYTDEQGNTRWVNNRTLETIQGNEALKAQYDILTNDISYLRENQKKLNEAVEANNVEKIREYRNKLFNVAALKSIREGIGEEFVQDLELIAQTDNSQVDEKGMTEAMRKGYADTTEDDSYKQTARQRIQDIKDLTKDYQTLRRTFKSKLAADIAFNQRGEVYALEKTVEEINKDADLLAQQVNKTVTDPLAAELVGRAANVNALEQIVAALEATPNASKRAINNLKNTLTVEKQIFEEALKDPNTRKALEENKGAIQIQTPIKANLFAARENLNEEKVKYNELLANPEKLEKDIEDLAKKAQKKKEKAERKKAKREKKEQEEADKEEAKRKKEETASKKAAAGEEKIGPFTLITKEDGTFEVWDDEANTSMGDFATRQEGLDLIAANQGLTGDGQEGGQEGLVTEGEPEHIQGDQGAPSADEEPVGDLSEDYNEPPPPGSFVLGLKKDIVVEPKTKTTELPPAPPSAEEEVKPLTEAALEEKEHSGKIKLKFRAVPDGQTLIQDKAKLIHDPSINVGTEVILRVAEDSPSKEVAKAVIEVVTTKGELLAYLPELKEKNPTLEATRKAVIEKGAITTSIIDKGPGKLNWGNAMPIQRVNKAFPKKAIKKIVINKNGKLYSNRKTEYVPNSTLDQSAIRKLNKDGTYANDGRVYIVTLTANGQEYAVPVDTAPVGKVLAESITTAYRLLVQSQYYGDEVTSKTLDTLFKEYDIDFRTPEGFRKYFNMFLHSYDLDDPAVVEKYSKQTEKRHWVKLSGNSLRWLKSGGNLKELSTNSVVKHDDGRPDPDATDQLVDGLLNELQDHLAGSLFHIDLDRLDSRKPFNFPLIRIDEEGELRYSEVKNNNYAEAVKEMTLTKVQVSPIGKDKYTAFVSPEVFISTSFLNQETQPEEETKPTEEPVEKSEETVTFTTEPEESLVPARPKKRYSKKAITPEVVEEAKKICKGK